NQSLQGKAKCRRGRSQAHQRKNREPLSLRCLMKNKAFVALILLFELFALPRALGQEASKVIPPKSKVFVAPMPDGFDDSLKAAIERKKVPLQIVADKDQADFQIAAQAETQKASTAKKV